MCYLGIQMEGNWHCCKWFFFGGGDGVCLFNPNQPFATEIPRDSRLGFPGTPGTASRGPGMAADPRARAPHRLAQGTRSARLAPLPACRSPIHVSLPSRRPAAENTRSGWERIPAITTRLPQLTSLRSFLGERAGCQVSEVSVPSPKPLNSGAPTPTTTRDLLYRATLIGRAP